MPPFPRIYRYSRDCLSQHCHSLPLSSTANLEASTSTGVSTTTASCFASEKNLASFGPIMAMLSRITIIPDLKITCGKSVMPLTTSTIIACSFMEIGSLDPSTNSAIQSNGPLLSRTPSGIKCMIFLKKIADPSPIGTNVCPALAFKCRINLSCPSSSRTIFLPPTNVISQPILFPPG